MYTSLRELPKVLLLAQFQRIWFDFIILEKCPFGILCHTQSNKGTYWEFAEFLLVLRSQSSSIHFACIWVAPPRLVTSQDRLRGSNSNIGKMDQTWYNYWQRLLHGNNLNKFIILTFSLGFFFWCDEDDKNERYNELILQAKDHISKSEVKLALQAYQEAAQIKPSDKLTKKISKCQVPRIYAVLSLGFFMEWREDHIHIILPKHWATERRALKILHKPMTGFHDTPSPWMEDQICGKVEHPRSRAGDIPVLCYF